MKTGEHILNLSSWKGDNLRTDGKVYSFCSCRKWRLDSVTREESRTAHREHVDAMAERDSAERASA